MYILIFLFFYYVLHTMHITNFFVEETLRQELRKHDVTLCEFPCFEPSLFKEYGISSKVLEYSIWCNVAVNGSIGWNLELGDVPRINSQSEPLQLRIASMRDLASYCASLCAASQRVTNCRTVQTQSRIGPLKKKTKKKQTNQSLKVVNYTVKFQYKWGVIVIYCRVDT
jgi:hypothetical protein